MYDILSKTEIEKHLNFPVPIFVFDEIDSTNTFAKTLTHDFALVVADLQTQGRGRLNRTFFSPKGSGIYLSLKIKVSDLYSAVPFITTLAAVSVHKAIKKLFSINCGIKWVNDIYIGNKKLAGILCEIADASHAVIGVGINFYPSDFPDDLKQIATHLTAYPSAVTRNELIGEIINNLLQLVEALPDSSFMEYYKAHSIVIGKKVLCIQGNSSFEATAVDIDTSGGLIVKTAAFTQTLSSGEVSLRLTD